MQRASREVREARLARFNKQKGELTSTIERLDALMAKAQDALETETDPDRRYGLRETCGALKRNISEATATLLRTNKAIEHELELIARLGTEEDAGAFDTEAEEGDEEALRHEAAMEAAEALLREPASLAPQALTPGGQELLQRILETIRTRGAGSVTLEDIDQLLKFSEAVQKRAPEDPVRQTFTKTLHILNIKMGPLTRNWIKIFGLK